LYLFIAASQRDVAIAKAGEMEVHSSPSHHIKCITCLFA
jgi:hypothetical protein